MNTTSRTGRLLRQRALPMLYLLATALFGGCTGPVAVDGQWIERVPKNLSFTNVLVIGVTPDYNTRCRFEYALADTLRSATVKATASCALMGSNAPLTREGVAPVVTSTGADAVLATRLVNRKTKLNQGTGDDTRAESYYKAVGYGINDNYFGYYGLPVTYVDFVSEEPVLTLQSTVEIATNLYETRNAALLYTIVSKARNVDSAGDFINGATTAIADQLQRDGLVN